MTQPSTERSETEELMAGTPAGESKSWNYHPDIPIQYSPLFSFPPNPLAIVKWFAGAWLPLDRWLGSFNDGSTSATKRLLRHGRKQG